MQAWRWRRRSTSLMCLLFVPARPSWPLRSEDDTLTLSQPVSMVWRVGG